MPNVTPNFGLYLPLVNDPTDQDLWGGYLNANFTSLDSLLNGTIPSGVLTDFAGASAPSGWLLCYGQAISRTTYSSLYSAIGTTYGAGDGTTTFNVPDFRGRVAAGVDNMGGATASRITAANSGITGTTLGAAGGNEQLHGHTHGVTDPTHAHQEQSSSYTGGSGYGFPSVAGDAGNSPLNVDTVAAATGISINSAGGGNSQNVQPTLMVNKIIKT